MNIEILQVKRGENECVILKVLKSCNLWPYIIFNTAYDSLGQISNENRKSYYFPNMSANKGDYIVLYSGFGKNYVSRNQKGTNTIFLYWNLQYSVWNNAKDTALLVQINDFKKVTV